MWLSLRHSGVVQPPVLWVDPGHSTPCVLRMCLPPALCSISVDVREGTRQLMRHVGSAKGIAAIRSAVYALLSEVCVQSMHTHTPSYVTPYSLRYTSTLRRLVHTHITSHITSYSLRHACKHHKSHPTVAPILYCNTGSANPHGYIRVYEDLGNCD